MDDPIIRLVDLHKAFGSLVVLDGVSLDLARGQTTVVLGPSGCGKTVLLRHAIGLIQPDVGQVFFDGKELTALCESELMEIRTRFGYLFQGGALFDSMSAVQNVMFPIQEHQPHLGTAAARRRAMECLAMVGLAEFADRNPTNLSGGQKKRVALARAVALRPEVILYDEPTTGLDPIRSDVINELILKLQRELNVTSLVVTHDMASAFKVGHRLVMLHKGRVIADAPPDEFRRIEEPRVKRFIQGHADGADLAPLKRAPSGADAMEPD